ncbi:MAG: hypothetical protein R3B06_02465 [Kofleriaceae bacterium]
MSRSLVPVALALVAVTVGAGLGGPFGVGAAFAIATAARLVAGQAWFGPADRDGLATQLIGGAVAGGAALGLALASSDAIGAVVGRGVEWSTLPVVRGSVISAATVALVVLAVTAAAELTLRRWLLEVVASALGRAGVTSSLADAGGVVAAAAAEAAIVPLPGARVGVFVTGVALGVIYLGAGRRLPAGLAARAGFEVTAVVLQALRLIG